jgi:hypothetical protein
MRDLHNTGKKLSDRGRRGGKARPLAATRGKLLPLSNPYRFTCGNNGVTP